MRPTIRRASHAASAAFFLTSLLLAPGRAAAQGATIRGTVRERDGGAPIPGARVEAVGTRFASVTRDDGAFVLGPVPPGEYAVRVLRVGYRPATVEHVHVDSAGAEPLAVVLERVPVMLSEVVVTPGYFGVMRTTLAAPQSLTRRQIETQPQVGEDIFRAMNRLPGLASADISANFLVRGGSGDELFVTLDGVELFEPFHLKDLDNALSIVDVAAIGGVDLTTGGFSTEVGNRLTGVLAMHSAEPPADRTRTSLGLSITNLRAMSQGGFAGGRGGWLASARRGYLDIALKLTADGDSLSPGYYDVFGKVFYDLGRWGRVAAHVLRAGDHLDYIDGDEGSINSHYGNGYGWLTWDARLGERVRQQSVLSLARLSWRRLGDEGDRAGRSLSLDEDRSFRSVAFRQDWSADLGTRALLKFGVDAKAMRATYHYVQWHRTGVLEGDEVVFRYDTTRADLAPSGTQLGAYVAQRVQPAASLTVEAGARYDRASYAGPGLVSPRLNASWSPLARTTVRAAWGRYTQARPLFALRPGDGLVTFARPERAEQRVLGVEQRLTATVTARLEGYDRRIGDPRPVLYNANSSLELFPEARWDRVHLDATSARARGVELFVRRAGGAHVDWSASYARAQAVDRVGRLTLPRQFDQRHTATADWAYRATSGRWMVSAAWTFHSGWPATPVHFDVDTLVNDGQHLGVAVTPRLGRLNSERLPSYYRVDARATRYFDTRHGRLALFLDVFNLLNRENPRGYEYGVTVVPRWQVTRAYDTQIPLLPSLGVEWHF